MKPSPKIVKLNTKKGRSDVEFLSKNLTMGKKVKLFFSNIKQPMRALLHRILNKSGVPALISNTEIYDSLTNQRINIKTGIYYSVITVNGRDYYFGRLNGKFSGTGSSLC